MITHLDTEEHIVLKLTIAWVLFSTPSEFGEVSAHAFFLFFFLYTEDFGRWEIEEAKTFV